MWREAAIGVVMVVVLALGGGCDRGGDNVLARFDGGVLTVEDVDAHLAGMKRSSRFRDRPELLNREFAFEHALNMEMIIAKGLAEELHLDPRIREELHRQMSELFLKVMENQLVTPIDRESISDEEALAYYQEHLENYQEPARYTLLVFSVDPEQGEEAITAIRSGEIDFAVAAGRYALSKQERESGGRTGTRTLRRFQPSWRGLVEALPVGEAVGPEVIDGTSYILLLEKKSEPFQHSFEEKKEYVRNDVLHSRYRDQWQEIYDGLRGRFKVRVNEERLAGYVRQEVPQAPELAAHPREAAAPAKEER